MRTRGTQGSQVARLVRPIPKTVGVQWFVDGLNGDDANNGYTPETAFATIGKALSVVADGAVITVGAAEYDEDNLDLNKDALVLRAVRGVIFKNTGSAGQVLKISGDSCVVIRLGLRQAGKNGIVITGDNALVFETLCDASNTAYVLQGNGSQIERAFSYNHTMAGFEVTGSQNLLLDVAAIGTGGSTRGAYLSAATADYNILRSVYSAGNSIASVEIVPGALGNTVEAASFGAGDGRWVGVDGNVWSRIAYEDTVYHTTTFAGGGPAGENLFRVYGAVEIEYITGDVVTQLSADVDDIYLHLYDGTNSDLITSSLGGGVDTSSAPVDSLFVKTEDASSVLNLLLSDQGRIYEQTSFVSPRVPFIANAASGVATYIRLEWDGTATSGVIHWHVKWRPLTETGFVAPA